MGSKPRHDAQLQTDVDLPIGPFSFSAQRSAHITLSRLQLCTMCIGVMQAMRAGRACLSLLDHFLLLLFFKNKTVVVPTFYIRSPAGVGHSKLEGTVTAAGA
jgi:hypothetical protein